MAIASFSSGLMLANFGWQTINEVIFPAIFVAGALLVWHSAGKRAKGRAV